MHLLIYAALLLGPRAAVTKTPAGHNLVLTASMLEAIDRWDPTFRPWNGNGKVNYGLDVYLTGQVPAGTYVGGDDERPKRIKFDAFEIEDWEKSSTAYLWNGRRFHAVLTSD